MTVINSSVFHVLEQFPGRGDEIKRLFRENPEFHSICEDYRRCAEAMHHWLQSKDREALARTREYAFLRQELMDEICLYLNKST